MLKLAINFAQFYYLPSLAQLVKNPPAMRETGVQSLGWEDPLEEGKATHSNIPAYRIPWTIHGGLKNRTQLSDFHFHFKSSNEHISMSVAY